MTNRREQSGYLAETQRVIGRDRQRVVGRDRQRVVGRDRGWLAETDIG